MSEPEMEIFATHDLPSVDDLKRQPFPLWNGKWCWLWGVTERQYLALRREARRQNPDGEFLFDEERYVICRFIECVRDSGDPGAKPIFNRRDHYDWLLERDRALIEGAVELSMRLSGELPEQQEALARFFAPANEGQPEASPATSSADSSASA